MIDGNLALQTIPGSRPSLIKNVLPNIIWSFDQHTEIVRTLQNHGCEYLKGRDEYTLLKETLVSNTVTQVLNSGNMEMSGNPVFSRVRESGVISPLATCTVENDTDTDSAPIHKLFLAPLDVQKPGSIAEVIPSYKAIQSSSLRLNIGYDTEYQEYIVGSEKIRRVLSLQMTIAFFDKLVRYFFLVDPNFQEVTEEGGKIPLKHCLADILEDLKKNYLRELPLVLKRNILYKEKPWKGHDPFKVIDYTAMKDNVIPVTIICHTGKADISVFRRTKYDIDMPKNVSEIQGGWMSTENVHFSAANDRSRNYYWLLNLCIRDTLGLTPADHKSLESLGKLIKKPKITLPQGVIEHMAAFAVYDPVAFYNYAMNDADIVISFCSELFQFNHAIPVTLSSAAASAIYVSIKKYFGVNKKADYDRVYRGLEMLNEGVVPSKDECMKYLKATRYVPIRDNPDAKIIISFFEEAYTGGFNASFYLGWITDFTTDFDLQNAYPTAMASILDIDWSEHVRDLPRDSLRLQDLMSPLTPAVAVGDFDFPDDCYCPNIPVPVNGGMKIYPLHGRNVYMTGPDMWLALKLGAKIKIFRGFICPILEKDGKPSQCLAYAVAGLVQDRMVAKKVFKDNPLVEKSIKTMVNSGYGKTAQNVSPKTRYNAKKMGRVAAEPSTITSPYHASYTTALVRCMLIACINELHDMGYHVYSVTTDGFITDAPTETVRSLEAFGFAQIFQNGRYILNQTREACEANLVWEPKHFNDTFLNITTRGNVAVNDEGVLAHNSYITGEVKDSRADRDAYIVAVLTRVGKLKCPTKEWTKFSEIVERKHDFHVSESIRQLSMNFDYKRRPIVETAIDTPVHYDSVDGRYHVDTVIAEFDTCPFNDAEEFLNYRSTMQNEDCVKVTADLERVKIKSTVQTKGYIGKDLPRKILLSILMGYRAGLYQIPALDNLKQSEVVNTVNSWGIAQITINDWKNCSRNKRQNNMLPRELVEKTLEQILSLGENA